MKELILLFSLITAFFGNNYASSVGFASLAGDSVAYQNLSVPDFQKLLADSTVQLVDVRTPAEFKAGHIPHALNIDVKEVNFEKNIEVLDPARPVAVYCRSGARSRKAARKLAEKGFRVYNLDKGFLSWPKD